MNMKHLESQIVANARRVLRNPKIKTDDIREWRSGGCEPRADEVYLEMEYLGIGACFLKTLDKRPKTDQS